MVISSKPKQKQIDSKADKVDVDALINKGGSVASNTNQFTKTEMLVNLRMPSDIVQQIDLLVSKRRIKTSRHTWLMEAIYDKLEKERNDEGY